MILYLFTKSGDKYNTSKYRVSQIFAILLNDLSTQSKEKLVRLPNVPEIQATLKLNCELLTTSILHIHDTYMWYNLLNWTSDYNLLLLFLINQLK